MSRLARSLGLLALAGLVLGAPAAARAGQAIAGALEGTVTIAGPEGEPFQVPGVTVTLTGIAPDLPSLTVTSDEAGRYEFGAVPAGPYLLRATLPGFRDVTRRVTITGGRKGVEDVRLELAAVTEEVTVRAALDSIDVRQVAPAPAVRQQALQAVPLATEQYQDALPLIPGVVRGPDGLLNLKGARASQSGLTVNSANVTDPVTGEFAINLPIEAVASIEVLPNPYSAEYGQFTGAVTRIETRAGTDAWKVQFQNFLPRVRRRDGEIRGVESATPRLAVSGPLVRERLTVFQSLQYRFTRTEVESLAAFENDTELESFDSFTQLDWQMGRPGHLTSTFSVFPQNLGYVGLNTFNPQPVTPNFRQRGFFGAANHRKVLGERSLLESVFSVKEFDADVFPAGPDGGPMTFSPDVNSGSFFNSQARDSRRYEALGAYTITPAALGSHVVKVGAGASASAFEGIHRSAPVRIVRADGTRSRQIDVAEDARVGADKTEWMAYVEDKWSAGPRLTLEYGVRYDRDTLADEHNLAPRAAVAFLPRPGGRTVIRGGVGLFYDKLNLNLATFEQLQHRLITTFAADGGTVAGEPMRQRPVVERGTFRTPRSVNWNIEFDREWVRHLLLRVAYQQRRGTREYFIDVAADPAGETLLLASRGRSSYREFQITARYALGRTGHFVASYVRSAATGELNDFNALFGNFPDPVIRPNERSRLPWDAPNRFLFWGEFRLKHGLDLAPVLEVRDGFPRSIIDEDRAFVGGRNRAGRFPRFASLDLQVLKSLRLPVVGMRVKAGVKVFNLLDQFNPRDFQGNLASASFGRFFNGVGRQLRGKFVIDF